MKIKTILVIDDDNTVHEMVDEFLSGEVEKISHAHTPEDGLRMATQQLPSLVLLDITMPRMDGLKVCRHLKESERTRDIPVLFLTVDHNIRHLAKALECGGSDYIMKPFNPVELRARVRAALRTKEMIDLLKEQARIDALTGVNNRTALDEALN
ncbi:MAG: response regulator, partial [Pseudomonadales bacterium]